MNKCCEICADKFLEEYEALCKKYGVMLNYEHGNYKLKKYSFSSVNGIMEFIHINMESKK